MHFFVLKKTKVFLFLFFFTVANNYLHSVLGIGLFFEHIRKSLISSNDEKKCTPSCSKKTKISTFNHGILILDSFSIDLFYKKESMNCYLRYHALNDKLCNAIGFTYKEILFLKNESYLISNDVFQRIIITLCIPDSKIIIATNIDLPISMLFEANYCDDSQIRQRLKKTCKKIFHVIQDKLSSLSPQNIETHIFFKKSFDEESYKTFGEIEILHFYGNLDQIKEMLSKHFFSGPDWINDLQEQEGLFLLDQITCTNPNAMVTLNQNGEIEQKSIENFNKHVPLNIENSRFIRNYLYDFTLSTGLTLIF